MLISLAVAFVVTPWLAGKLTANVAHVSSPFASWLHVLALILISLALPVGKQVILKMLPFDNKSEFQVMMEWPAGPPARRWSAQLQ